MAEYLDPYTGELVEVPEDDWPHDFYNPNAFLGVPQYQQYAPMDLATTGMLPMPGDVDKYGIPEPYDIATRGRQQTGLYKDINQVFDPQWGAMMSLLSGNPALDYFQQPQTAVAYTPTIDRYETDDRYGWIATEMRNGTSSASIKNRIRQGIQGGQAGGDLTQDEVDDLISEVDVMDKERNAAAQSQAEAAAQLSPVDEMFRKAGLPSPTQTYDESNIPFGAESFAPDYMQRAARQAGTVADRFYDQGVDAEGTPTRTLRTDYRGPQEQAFLRENRFLLDDEAKLGQYAPQRNRMANAGPSGVGGYNAPPAAAAPQDDYFAQLAATMQGFSQNMEQEADAEAIAAGKPELLDMPNRYSGRPSGGYSGTTGGARSGQPDRTRTAAGGNNNATMYIRNSIEQQLKRAQERDQATQRADRFRKRESDMDQNVRKGIAFLLNEQGRSPLRDAMGARLGGLYRQYGG